MKHGDSIEEGPPIGRASFAFTQPEKAIGGGAKLPEL